MARPGYHPEHFVFVQPEEESGGLLNIDSTEYPCRVWLDAAAEVTLQCDASIITSRRGRGKMLTLEGGNIAFRSCELGIDVHTLNGPLILQAAENQGITVKFQHVRRCACKVRGRGV